MSPHKKTQEEFLTSAQPLVVVKLEPLVKCDQQAWQPLLNHGKKIGIFFIFIISYVEMWDFGVIQ